MASGWALALRVTALHTVSMTHSDQDESIFYSHFV